MWIIAIFVLSSGGVFAAEWVSSYAGPDGGIELLRHGESITVAIYTPLMAGDRLIIKDEHGVVVIEADDGTIKRIGQEQSPYDVEGQGQPSGLGSNVTQWVGGWFGMTAGNESRIAELSSRGDAGNGGELSIPLVPTGRAKLVAPATQLTLAWQGLPPFAVSIIRVSDGNEVLNLRGVQKPQVMVQTPNWGQGEYLVTVSDARRTVDILLELVSRDEMPATPSQIGDLSVSQSMRQVLQAAWLADSESYQWRLQAYQDIQMLASEYAPANVLIEGLNRGYTVPLTPSD